MEEGSPQFHLLQCLWVCDELHGRDWSPYKQACYDDCLERANAECLTSCEHLEGSAYSWCVWRCKCRNFCYVTFREDPQGLAECLEKCRSGIRPEGFEEDPTEVKEPKRAFNEEKECDPNKECCCGKQYIAEAGGIRAVCFAAAVEACVLLCIKACVKPGLLPAYVAVCIALCMAWCLALAWITCCEIAAAALSKMDPDPLCTLQSARICLGCLLK